MMDRCPKCGFNQPDDKYCPQCGVDIERYRPKKLSLIAQLVASSSFYIFLAIVIAIATGYLIATELKIHRLRQDQRAAANQELLLNRPVSATVNSPPSIEEKSPASLLSSASQARVGPETRGGSTTNGLPPLPTSTTLTPTSRGISKLRLFYVEGLVEFFPGGSGYADRDTILDSRGQPMDSKARILTESVISDLTLNREATDSQLTEDPRLDRNAHGIGVVTRITPRFNDSRSTKLDVNISSRYPDVLNTDRTLSVRSNTPPQFQVDLVTSRVFYIGGLVPHRMYGEGEDALRDLAASNSVLRVMLSPTFAAQRFATDFILLIAAATDSLND